MSKFAKHFSNMFMSNASESACSSFDAVNTAVAEFIVTDFTDTVFAVSVLLFSIIAIISHSFLVLINIIILAAIINIICIKGSLFGSKTK